MNDTVVLSTNIEGLPPPRRGKVRDIYETDEHLLIVATDRVSAFDVVLPDGIPGKGRVLTQVSHFWFNYLAHLVPNHLISVEVADFPEQHHGRLLQSKNHRKIVRTRQLLTGSEHFYSSSSRGGVLRRADSPASHRSVAPEATRMP